MSTLPPVSPDPPSQRLSPVGTAPIETASSVASRPNSCGRWSALVPWGLMLVAVLVAGGDRVGSFPEAGDGLRPASAARSGSPPRAHGLRLVLWNIHSGVGLDGTPNLDRIASELRTVIEGRTDEAGTSAAPSGLPSGRPACLVGFNEVRSEWTGGDLAGRLGESLNLPSLFAPAERQWGRDHFGNGIVGDVAVTMWQRIPLPNKKGKGYRNVVRLRCRVDDQDLSVLVTHIDRNTDRVEQLRVVFDLFLAMQSPVVLLGDLNTPRGDAQLDALLSRSDVVDLVGPFLKQPRTDRIDWVIGRGLSATAGGLVESTASDHPLLWVDVREMDERSGNRDAALPSTD